MMADITARWRRAEISEAQATGAIAWLTDTTADDITGYVVVALRRNGTSLPQICVVSSFGTDRGAVEKVLRHTAAHITGKCRPCRLRARMRANGAG